MQKLPIHGLPYCCDPNDLNCHLEGQITQNENLPPAEVMKAPEFYRARSAAAFENPAFVSKVLANTEVGLDGCLRWRGYVSPSGYGVVHLPKFGSRRIHRVIWEKFVGPIPETMTLDHQCHTRNCLNRHHLRLATVRENSLNSETSPVAVNARKTHCVNGHEFTTENTRRYRRNGGHWRRDCKLCKTIAQRERRQRKALEAEEAK